MTQIVSWIRQSLSALVAPSPETLEPETKATVEDVRHIVERLAPPIEDYLREKGHQEFGVGCGWRDDRLSLIVSVSKNLSEEDLAKISLMTETFPLVVEPAPELSI